METELLKAIFERQHEFSNKLGRQVETDWYSSVGRFKYPGETEEAQHVLKVVNEHATASIMEATELKDWTPWKHWSQQSGNKKFQPREFMYPGHVKEMRLEVVDNLCFLINAAMALGMTPEMLNVMHADKVAVNHRRQSEKDY